MMEDIKEHDPQPVTGRCPIVGIGASTGGLEPLIVLLSHLPGTTGLAYIVLQHLDPRAPSLLVDLLARATRLPVQQIEQGMEVEADHVYVCPANAEITRSVRITAIPLKGPPARQYCLVIFEEQDRESELAEAVAQPPRSNGKAIAIRHRNASQS